MAEKIDLPRRKVLGALSAVGVGSAAGGLGTSAFFSDQETYENNRLVAGSLDLKMDWQEHYSDWSEDEEQYAGMGTQSSHDYELPGGSDGESIFLDFDDGVQNAQQKFMATTAREAYPDGDNDGINDYSDLEGVLGDSVASDPGDICNVGADTPEDLDPRLPGNGGAGTGLRTFNDDTWDSSATAYKSLINISDVKPGDFGEVTFSLHLCDNPGYLWMFADNLDGAENGVNEPESKDPDEDQVQGSGDPALKSTDPNASGKTVELLDKLQVRVWYDGAEGTDSVASSGNNLKDPGEPIVGEGTNNPTLQGSLREVITALTSDPGVPLDGSRFCSTHITDGIDLSATTTDPVEYDCFATSDVQPRCEDFFADDAIDAAPRWESDGGDLPGTVGTHTLTKTIGDYEYSVDLIVNNTEGGQPTEIELENIQWENTTNGNTGPGFAAAVIVKAGPGGNVCVPPDSAGPSSDPDGPDEGADTTDGEKWFTAPTNPGGNVDPGISFLELCLIRGSKQIPPGEIPPQDGGPRDCLVNSTTAYIGFEWWLPIDHGNEVQTDSVSFDLGFYTEQCRHNDGSGMSRTQ